MKYIELTQGQFTKVDDEEYEKVFNFGKWSAHWSPITQSYYAVREVRINGKRTTIHMNVFIMGVGNKSLDVDHRNHDTLDNQKHNLRICTRSQNNANRRIFKNNISGYKGVGLHEGKYRARIRLNNKEIYLGYFENPEDAARAYDAAAIEYFGEFALLNFPETR